MKLGLIAGNGRFPILFARTARQQGIELVAIAHQGESLPELASELDHLVWIKVGELQKIIDVFRAAGVERAVMAGGIHKIGLLDSFAPDERAQQMLMRLGAWGDDAILRGVAAELESEGIAIVESTLFLATLLAPAGVIAGEPPSPAELADIEHGYDVAKAIGAWDIGQSIVIKSGMVLAVEAIEGTDATIARGGRPGAVVVKVSKPTQDLRFDVPAVGPHTVANCRAAGVSVLAVESGKTLLLDRDELVREATTTGLKIFGFEAESPLLSKEGARER
ncbi:MAG TPA: UDP-2,3-diacylglucosamine diphosphatase LpxI [Terriglobales bacterium]|nr:UDP-2,3-diacylglucosamine diphosphatase LpxI [Terriglobales bacterium]